VKRQPSRMVYRDSVCGEYSAVAEAWGQLGNQEEGECPPLEAVTG
jgi:hypothetical protein